MITSSTWLRRAAISLSRFQWNVEDHRQRVDVGEIEIADASDRDIKVYRVDAAAEELRLLAGGENGADLLRRSASAARLMSGILFTNSARWMFSVARRRMNQGCRRKWSNVKPTNFRIASAGASASSADSCSPCANLAIRTKSTASRAPPCCRSSGRAGACWQRRARRSGRRGRHPGQTRRTLSVRRPGCPALSVRGCAAAVAASILRPCF